MLVGNKIKPATFLEGTMTFVPLRLVVDHPDIPHRELDRDHVKELFDDISRHGLDQPLLVWNGGGEKGKQMELEGGKRTAASFLIAGAHRRAALRQLFKTNPERYKELFPNGVNVKVFGGEIQDALAVHLRENLQRKDMTAEQVLPIIKLLRDEHGMKQKEIARAVGKSEGYISQIFDIEEELGEDADEVIKSGVKLSEARDLAKEAKSAKKAGKKLDVKAKLGKLKDKAAARKAAGRVREDKRVSAKTVWKRYRSLPTSGIKMGARVMMLENALGYLAGDEEFELPAELSVEQEVETKKSKKAEAEDEGEE